MLDLSICIGSSERDRGRERERTRDTQGRDGKMEILLVFARSIQYLYLPTYLTYVLYLVRYITLHYITLHYITFRNANVM